MGIEEGGNLFPHTFFLFFENQFLTVVKEKFIKKTSDYF